MPQDHAEPETVPQAAAAPQRRADGPSPMLGRRRVAGAAVLIVLALLALYLLLPKLAGLNQTWGRLQRGDPVWLAVAAGFELLSIAGYAVLFRTVFGRGMPRLDWRVSVQIPLAGIAAIRLVAAAGAGAVAVTAWALDRAGMEARQIACRMVANIALQYAVYLAAIVVFGVALATGVLPGPAPFALTVIPALLSIALAGAVLSAVLVPEDVERRLRAIASGPRWWRALIERLAAAPAALGAGMRTAAALIRERRPGLLGAVGYWGFDIAALGFSFLAFGSHPAIAVLVLGYFLGTLGSLLPLPGGIGGVEGAMIGAFVAFGVHADQAVVAVLAYRAISFWLPTLPGVAGYFLLRRTVRAWGALDPSPAIPALVSGADSSAWSVVGSREHLDGEAGDS
ncbi:MAG TPA: lysylphosphatidylglycerol synthase transmembrane domain-containing protein [Solirubrobacteraceae bacterium]|nr:lysylphosphatidylglycerol synthase transmembrane domain-containing protein [Solirubrobacteraceae bacterium]